MQLFNTTTRTPRGVNASWQGGRINLSDELLLHERDLFASVAGPVRQDEGADEGKEPDEPDLPPPENY